MLGIVKPVDHELGVVGNWVHHQNCKEVVEIGAHDVGEIRKPFFRIIYIELVILKILVQRQPHFVIELNVVVDLIDFDQVCSSVYNEKSIVKNVETFQITFIGHGIKEIKFVDQLQSNLFILPLLINSNLALDCHRNNDIFICM